MNIKRSLRGMGGWQIQLLVAVVGLVLLGLIFIWRAPEQRVGFRLAWLGLTGVGMGILYRVYHQRTELSWKRLSLLMLLIVLQVLLIQFWLCQIPFNILGHPVSEGQLMLVLPYGLAPMAASVLLGRRLGVFATLCTTFIGTALMPTDFAMANYVVLSLLAGLIGALLCDRVEKRDKITKAGFVTGAAVFVAASALGCFRETDLSMLHGGFNVGVFLCEAVAAVVMGIIVSSLTGGLTPFLEIWFNISTHMTWLEWSDMNHPVLRELQMKAPGTFHHSLCVQRLAEAAAGAVGADVTCVGVCGLYHDIGKLKNPDYFTENIGNHAFSPHNNLTAEVSSYTIIKHVKDGVEIAYKNKLNSRIIDAIREHHGTQLPASGCFYRKAMESYVEEKKKFDEGLIDTCPTEVDKAKFVYEGPIPQTRESGIVSMADAVESATRSLVNPTEKDRREMIDRIFRERMLDGHLKDCQLTLGELDKIKESFLTTLISMDHTRIAYPPRTGLDDEVVPAASAGQVK